MELTQLCVVVTASMAGVAAKGKDFTYNAPIQGY